MGKWLSLCLLQSVLWTRPVAFAFGRVEEGAFVGGHGAAGDKFVERLVARRGRLGEEQMVAGFGHPVGAPGDFCDDLLCVLRLGLAPELGRDVAPAISGFSGIEDEQVDRHIGSIIVGQRLGMRWRGRGSIHLLSQTQSVGRPPKSAGEISFNVYGLVTAAARNHAARLPSPSGRGPRTG